MADTVCFTDTTHFTNTSSIALPFTITSYDWNFGDQTTHDTAQVPKHNFNLPGLYQTVLTVTTNASCYTRDTVIAVVHAKPSADYTPAQVSCALTPTTFQNQSVIASPDLLSKFIWNFGDNSIDSVQNPVHFFSQQGKYAVSLTVTSNFGCASTALDTVEVFAALQADFIDTNFCIGDVTKFTDVTPSLSIVSWQWSFGDGSLPTAVQNPMHTFSIPSIYQVTLKVQNAIGCVAYVAKNVQIVQQPVADFTKLLLCVGSYFTPVDSSYSPNDPITRWQWNINGSLFNSYQPSYYFADTGTYSATLVITSQHGCSDSVSKMVQVKPNAHADFISFPLYGEAPLDVTFTNQSTGAATYWWSFGDGSYTADVSPLHTYTNNGTYTILLAATSQYGCTDTTARNFTVVPTDLDISVDEVRTQQTSLADGSLLLTVTAKMSNVGTRLVTNMQLYATVGSGGMIEEDWNGALQSGQIMDYIFTSQFVISAANTNSYVCVEAKNVNHGETELRYDNNRQCAPMNGNIQLAGPIPNPAFNQSSLGIVLPKAGKITLGIYDAIGNTVIPETEISLAAGRTDYQLPVGQLLAAEYFIKVKYLDDVLIKKLVVR
jgi:PKD repeat protein